MLDFGFLKTFNSKTSAFIEADSTLCQIKKYFELVKMYLLGLKYIFRKLLGPEIPSGAKMTKSLKVAKSHFSAYSLLYLHKFFHFWYIAIILRHFLGNLTFYLKLSIFGQFLAILVFFGHFQPSFNPCTVIFRNIDSLINLFISLALIPGYYYAYMLREKSVLDCSCRRGRASDTIKDGFFPLI